MEQSTLAIIIVLLAIVSFALEKIPVALTAIPYWRHWQWPYLGLLITVKHIRISVLRRL